MTNAEMDLKLCQTYPKIFRDRNKPMQETALCWGFEVGTGWFNILDHMCFLIQSHIDASRKSRASALKFNRTLGRAIKGDTILLEKYYTYKNRPLSDYSKQCISADIAEGRFQTVFPAVPQVTATQVKEKFGTLRFYYSGGDEYISGVVSMGESLTGSTCDFCGKPGKSSSGGWIKVRCEEHENVR